MRDAEAFGSRVLAEARRLTKLEAWFLAGRTDFIRPAAVRTIVSIVMVVAMRLDGATTFRGFLVCPGPHANELVDGFPSSVLRCEVKPIHPNGSGALSVF
jgi:hypothetical protein